MPRCLLLNQSGHGTSSIAALAVTLHRVTQRDHQRSQERPREIRVALPSTKFENAKSNGLATVAAGANCFARVSGKLADARHRCRRSIGYYVGTRWYRVRRRVGRTRYLWSLRDHRPANGLCPVRAQSHLGSWTRLSASGDHTWCCFSAIGGDTLRAVALAGMMAVVSGLVCILAGVARLGFVTELLSKPIRYGYMNGIALAVVISQLPKVFGFSIDVDGPLRKLWAIGGAILNGRANWTAFAIGAGTLVVILLLKNSKRVPGILIGVIGATTVVAMLNLAERADVSVLGPLPQGLPV